MEKIAKIISRLFYIAVIALFFAWCYVLKSKEDRYDEAINKATGYEKLIVISEESPSTDPVLLLVRDIDGNIIVDTVATDVEIEYDDPNEGYILRWRSFENYEDLGTENWANLHKETLFSEKNLSTEELRNELRRLNSK